ncbi:MAG TPA: ornithine carbamoyltransferase [Polyangia bacterium]|jgi:ornithine carbamoyltransferase|nr:ornithine carbamoyltransferase [Polyangia bacterium]
MSETPKHFLSFWDLPDRGIEGLIRRAEEFRLLRSLREPHATRPGRVLGMVFEKASTRTRASFEIAMYELGGHALFLPTQGSQLGRGEPIRDTARVLSGYCHAIMIRTFGQERAAELAAYASVPVINGLTDLLHPCQVLADLQTVAQRFGGGAAGGDVAQVLRRVRYAWIGDGNNMANSWIEAAGILGLDLALACPPGHEPNADIFARARQTERGRITVTHAPAEAAAGRHVISTDVFASMGQEAEAETRLQTFAGFCIDRTLMSCAADDAIVLHCLPAHRGEEISDEVIEGPQSLVWRQAENRLHAQKALLESLLA